MLTRRTMDTTQRMADGKVLVSLGQRTRAVTFAVGDSSLDSLQNLQNALRVAFADSPLLSTECRVIIQVSVCIVRVYFICWPC